MRGLQPSRYRELAIEIRLGMILALLTMLWIAGSTRPAKALPLTLVVNTADNTSDGVCDGVHCSLREAIIEANNNPGPDTIHFNIPPGGPTMIQIGDVPGVPGPTPDNLPAITDVGLTIDGTTQPGSGALPAIQLHYTGSSTTIATRGLDIVSSNNVVKGLSVTGFGTGVRLWGEFATDNLIDANFIGVVPNGMATATPSDIGYGIHIVSPFYGAGNNTIQNNVIGGYAYNGFGIKISGQPNNTIHNNMVGVSVDFTALPQTPLPNSYGIHVTDSDGNFITSNIISGNSFTGLVLVSSSNNVIQNNFIGTNSSGVVAMPNQIGLALVNDSANNLVGGAIGSEGNLISGNAFTGVEIGEFASGNQLAGNLIGLNAAGTAAIPNGAGACPSTSGIYSVGVAVFGPANMIGGPNPTDRNVISGTGSGLTCGTGIFLLWPGAIGNQVLNNYVGTDALAAAAISNSIGIRNAGGATDTLIQGNVVSGNRYYGIVFTGGTGTIQGNLVGTNGSGMTAVPNCSEVSGAAIAIGSGATNVLVQDNLISGNGVFNPGITSNPCGGVAVSHSDSVGHQILDNEIGLDASGGLLPNFYGGISLSSGTDNNLVEGNTVAGGLGGQGTGILVSNWCSMGDAACGAGDLPANNVIRGNFVGTDASGTAVLPVPAPGVRIAGAQNTVIEDNIIANNYRGVVVTDGATAARITGNSIFDNEIGFVPGLGIDLADAGYLSDPTLGPNPNDPGDADTGANTFLNYPEMDNTATTSQMAVGIACPGCTVEVFIASPDPSGYGEGKTLVGAGVADGVGNFNIALAGVSGSVELTATATDAQGNTSEFSPLVAVVATSAIRVAGTIIGLFIPIVLGGLGGWLGWRRKTRLPEGLLGAVVGVGAGLGLYLAVRMALRSAPTRSQRPAADSAAVLVDDETLRTEQLRHLLEANPLQPKTLSAFRCADKLLDLNPPNGAIFEPGSKPWLSWGVVEPLPGNSVFRLRVFDTAGNSALLTTSDTAVDLASLGLLNENTKVVYWQVWLEGAIVGESHAAICHPSQTLKFAIGEFLQTPEETLAIPVVPSPLTPTLTPTPTPEVETPETPAELPSPTPTPTLQSQDESPPDEKPTDESPLPDTTGPKIGQIDVNPAEIPTESCNNNTSIVTAEINDPSGVALAEVHWQQQVGKNTIEGTLAMKQNGTSYTTRFGPFKAAGKVSIVINAEDGKGNVSQQSGPSLNVVGCVQ